MTENSTADRLVIQAQTGDPEALQRLYLYYYDLVYGYGRMMLRDEHEAEDVTQDVFMRVLRLLPRYQPRVGQPFRILLLRITRNRSIDYLRRRGRWDVQPADEVEGRVEPRDLPDDPTGSFDALTDAELERALLRLPHTQRQVLALRYWLDLSTEEVAEIVGVTPQAVRNLQYRGLKSLRLRLAVRQPGEPLAA